MPQPMPAPKFEELRERLSVVVSDVLSGSPLNEMEWRRILKDFEALEKNPLHARYSSRAIAVLWSLKGDIAKVDTLFNRSANLYGRDFEWYLNRGTTGAQMNHLDYIVDLSLQEVPEDDYLLMKVANFCLQSGLFVSASRLLIRRDMMLSVDPSLSPWREVNAIAEYISSANLDEVAIAERVFCARAVVARYASTRSASFYVTDAGVMFELDIALGVDKISEVNLAIVRKIVDEFEDDISEHISIGVVADIQENR